MLIKLLLSIEDIDKLLISNSSDKDDEIKRYKFIQNLKNKIKSNQIITKKIYNFKNYEFVAWKTRVKNLNKRSYIEANF